MQSTLSVIEPAADISLLTLYEARLGMNLASSTDENLDDLIDLLIKWASDEVATECNRIFAKEKLKEVVREIDVYCSRIFLSHYPIVKVDTVDENGTLLVEDVDYEIDIRSGRLNRLGDNYWSEPVTITYTGGYELPHEAPPALQQAAILLAREAYYASTRGDATVRMVSHKDSRIIYFDPNARGGAGAAAGSGGSPARRAVGDLLKKYTRFWL